MKICRLCLCNDIDKIVSVFDYSIEDLATKIQDFLSIKISEDDNLPKCVCTDCINQILQWESFQKTCQTSNELLCNNVIFQYTKLDESILTLDSVEIIKQERVENEKNAQADEEEEEDVFFYEDEDENYKLARFTDFLDLPDLPFETNPLLYECEICLKNFDNLFEYLDHQNLHEGDNIFKCDKCSEAFNSRGEIVQHDRNHQIPCSKCGKLVLRASMKLHLIKHTDRYRCSQCNTRCSSGAALKQHIINVHTDVRDFVCEICGKCFSSVSAIRVHRKSHSDKRMYPCKQCSYAGRTASALYIHMSTHANDLCVCDICSKVFKSNRNLTDHMRRVHSEIKKHTCDYCSKRFVDKYMLKVHVRWHTNVRPYHCTICWKTFIRSDGLKEHMNTHKPRNLVECPKCNKKFLSSKGVSRHNCLAIAFFSE